MHGDFSQDIWGGTTKVHFLPQNNLPLGITITAVAAICTTTKGHIVLAHVPRGYDLPGGHIEDGESPEKALSREILEEVGGNVISEPLLLGIRRMQKVKKHKKTNRYPDVAGIAVYLARVKLLQEYSPQKESLGRAVVELDQIQALHHHWSDQEQEILKYAYQKHPEYFAPIAVA